MAVIWKKSLLFLHKLLQFANSFITVFFVTISLQCFVILSLHFMPANAQGTYRTLLLIKAEVLDLKPHYWFEKRRGHIFCDIFKNSREDYIIKK